MPKLYREVVERFELDDDPLKGWIEVVHLEDDAINRIAEKVTRTVNRVGMDGKPERVQEVDLNLDRMETVDAAVRNWGNFFDDNDNPLPCTSENKRKWALDNWFMAHVRRIRQELAGRVAAEREEAAKN